MVKRINKTKSKKYFYNKCLFKKNIFFFNAVSYWCRKTQTITLSFVL